MARRKRSPSSIFFLFVCLAARNEESRRVHASPYSALTKWKICHASLENGTDPGVLKLFILILWVWVINNLWDLKSYRLRICTAPSNIQPFFLFLFWLIALLAVGPHVQMIRKSNYFLSFQYISFLVYPSPFLVLSFIISYLTWDLFSSTAGGVICLYHKSDTIVLFKLLQESLVIQKR